MKKLHRWILLVIVFLASILLSMDLARYLIKKPVNDSVPIQAYPCPTPVGVGSNMPDPDVDILKDKQTDLETNTTDSHILELINNERGNNGITKLVGKDKLNKSAELKADDMCEYGYWSHISPNGLEPWYFFRQVGYKYKTAGENLAKGFSNDGDMVVAWMNSDGHRENILNKDFREFGLSVKNCVIGGKMTRLVVTHFGRT